MYYIFIPRHTIVAGYYGFSLDVRVSVRFCITRVNINGFSPNLACALILCRSGLGLLMGKFRYFLWLNFYDTIMTGYYILTFFPVLFNISSQRFTISIHPVFAVDT